jgi:hypothetical protein
MYIKLWFGQYILKYTFFTFNLSNFHDMHEVNFLSLIFAEILLTFLSYFVGFIFMIIIAPSRK